MQTGITEEKKLKGLGGWLILVGLAVIISPFRIIATTFPIYSEIFSSESWKMLATPGSETYHALWAPILLGEVVINGALVLIWIYIIFLFFIKKKGFPSWYIGVLVFTLAFMLIDALAIKVVIKDGPLFDPETGKEFVRTFIGTIIWVPYMLLSKRVKATFVK